MKKIMFFAMLFMSCSVHAYELATHAAMTRKATLTSNLMNNNLIKDNGMELLLTDSYLDHYAAPLGNSYYDVQGSTSQVRYATDFERLIIQHPLKTYPLSPKGWLMRGVIREDDSGYLWGFNIGVTEETEHDGSAHEPYDDPYGNINRWCNHFFDPTKSDNRGATFYCPGDGEVDAATWALGVNKALANDTENVSRRNHFSTLDAREAMYRALTGKTKSGALAEPSANTILDQAYVRKRYWATVFRSLGDLAHLNQDMGQPQHTRNESHAGVAGFIGGDPFYEKYMDARIRGKEFFNRELNTKMVFPDMNFGSYPIPNFSKYIEYWTDSATKKGLADYSNRGFFTLGNNIGNSNYALPDPSPAAYGTAVLLYPADALWGSNTTYLTGRVEDGNDATQSVDGVLLSREGAYNEASNSNNGYTLDRNNFDAMANLLIPRAVAYSAGLINYFFRGRMQISLPDEGVYGIVDQKAEAVQIADTERETNFKGFSKIKLKLAAMATDYRGLPQEFSGGKITLVLKFQRNICYKNDLTGYMPFLPADGWDSCRSPIEEIITADGPVNVALSGTPLSMEFNLPQALPLNATDIRLQVVYRGALGDEADAVVAATQDISEPFFYTYMNASDYYKIAGAVYTRDQINAQPALLAQVVPQSCVDYTLNPVQLKPSCLQPFDISWNVHIGSTQVGISNLPLRNYVRFAILGNAEQTIVIAPHASNTCYPRDPFQLTTRAWQENYDGADPLFDLGQVTTAVSYADFEKVRDISSSHIGSCVGNADGSGGGDNRDTAMSNMPVLTHLPVSINGF